MPRSRQGGETYIVTTDITASDTCFRVLADRVTLDLGGKTITGPGHPPAVGISDNSAPRTSTLVKNGSIAAFQVAINLLFSTRSTVRSVTASDNATGMVLGPNTLLKDCIVQRSGGVGVDLGDRSQVEGCVIGGDEGDEKGGVGIFGGNRMLVTRNTVVRNGDIGIAAGTTAPCRTTQSPRAETMASLSGRAAS